MQGKNYQNLNQVSQTEDNIAVGVPVPQSQGQHAPYFQNPQAQPQVFQGQNPIQVQAPQFQHFPHNLFGVNPQLPNIINYNEPLNIQCPCCSNLITTVVASQPGNTTYVWAGILCLFVSPCCACVPFLTDRCMDRNHFCPNCGFYVMKKHRTMFDC